MRTILLLNLLLFLLFIALAKYWMGRKLLN